jgi:hypothetical protein
MHPDYVEIRSVSFLQYCTLNYTIILKQRMYNFNIIPTMRRILITLLIKFECKLFVCHFTLYVCHFVHSCSRSYMCDSVPSSGSTF